MESISKYLLVSDVIEVRILSCILKANCEETPEWSIVVPKAHRHALSSSRPSRVYAFGTGICFEVQFHFVLYDNHVHCQNLCRQLHEFGQLRSLSIGDQSGMDDGGGQYVKKLRQHTGLRIGKTNDRGEDGCIT